MLLPCFLLSTAVFQKTKGGGDVDFSTPFPFFWKQFGCKSPCFVLRSELLAGRICKFHLKNKPQAAIFPAINNTLATNIPIRTAAEFIRTERGEGFNIDGPINLGRHLLTFIRPGCPKDLTNVPCGKT